jgi:hypothetical protein
MRHLPDQPGTATKGPLSFALVMTTILFSADPVRSYNPRDSRKIKPA